MVYRDWRRDPHCTPLARSNRSTLTVKDVAWKCSNASRKVTRFAVQSGSLGDGIRFFFLACATFLALAAASSDTVACHNAYYR